MRIVKILCFIFINFVNSIPSIKKELNRFPIDLNTTVYKSIAYNPFGKSIKLTKKAKLLGYTILVNHSSENEEIQTNFKRKRNVINLYNMISCATGCNPLSYKGYGCFCGFLGSGQAVDGIDRCCKNHDWCYNTANCPYSLEYFIPYYWTCFNNIPYCSINHGIFGGSNSCSYKLCECDRILSNCLKNYNCPGNRAVCKTSPFRYIQNILMNF